MGCNGSCQCTSSSLALAGLEKWEAVLGVHALPPFRTVWPRWSSLSLRDQAAKNTLRRMFRSCFGFECPGQGLFVSRAKVQHVPVTESCMVSRPRRQHQVLK